MNSVLLTIAGLAPCVVGLAICVALLRRFHPEESFGNVGFTVFCGLLTVPVAILIAVVFDLFSGVFAGSLLAFETYDAFVVAGFAEECARGVLLRFRLGFRRQQASSSYCLICGAIVGLGFAMIENPGYCIDRGWSATWERAITSVPFHALAGSIVGYACGLSLFRKNLLWLLAGAACMTLLHGFNNFNWSAIYAGSDPGTSQELPKTGLAGLLVSGWPSNLATVFVCGVVVFLLARRFGYSAPRVTVSDVAS